MAAKSKATKEQAPVKKKWNWKVTLAALVVGSVIGTLTVLVMDKFRPHNVICKIVGVDEESAVVAARCMIK